jgi:hypothetical protein
MSNEEPRVWRVVHHWRPSRSYSHPAGGRVVHWVTLKHRYGPDGELEWVDPACGVRSGQGRKPAKTDRRCVRCVVAEASAQRPDEEDTA